MRLKGKVCVVTGSSRGIGAAIAEAYSREGATVAITYNEQSTIAAEVARRCNTDMVYQMNVRYRDSIHKVFEEVSSRHGRIDVLVNNAGVNCTNNFDELTEEEWDLVLDVDLKGVFLCCQEVLRLMPDGGRVINIGSLSGEYGGPRTPSYAAAKAGVMALTHCLARFVGKRNICVNCLSPGVVDNEFTASSMSEGVRKFVDSLLLIPRTATYADITGPAVFLASDEAAYITGQTISVNGGAWVR
jgi:3-oxoacyl-[acyl-carrier protein] reductase